MAKDVQIVEAKPVVRAKKPTALAFNRVLKKNRFSPLQILITQVFPGLEPAKQADVLLHLMTYQYQKISAAGSSKSRKIQVNTQIVNGPQEVKPGAPALPQTETSANLTLAELMKIASGPK